MRIGRPERRDSAQISNASATTTNTRTAGTTTPSSRARARDRSTRGTRAPPAPLAAKSPGLNEPPATWPSVLRNVSAKRPRAPAEERVGASQKREREESLEREQRAMNRDVDTHESERDQQGGEQRRAAQPKADILGLGIDLGNALIEPRSA